MNRTEGKVGVCRSSVQPIVWLSVPYAGEEWFISGKNGSGTIFFGNCNLKCVFCQSYQFSQEISDQRQYEISFEDLAGKMIELQEAGCHNINFVSPTHFVPQILKALVLAIPRGLHIPLVYNTNAYEDMETLKLLDGVIDIYLPDMKYASDETAFKYSRIKNYVSSVRMAVREMYRQVGELRIHNGVATSGLVIRHLILPGHLAGTEETLRWIAENLSPNVAIHLMSQYFPAYKATELPPLHQQITRNDFTEALGLCKKYGFDNVLIQDFGVRPWDNGLLSA